MYPYPPAFPVEEAKLLVAAMTGGPSAPPVKETKQAAWVVGGYALSLSDPSTPPIKAGQSRVTVGEMRQHLQDAVTASEKELKTGIKLPPINIPWCELYCLLFRTIQEGVQILVDANCYC